MDIPVFLFIIFIVVLGIVTVVGHGVWLLCGAVIRSLSDSSKGVTPIASGILTWRCETCSSEVRASWIFCGDCGAPKSSDIKLKTLRDLAATERQIEAFRHDGKIDPLTFENLRRVISDERIRLTTPKSAPTSAAASNINKEPDASKVQLIEVPSAVYEEPRINPDPVPTFFSATADSEPSRTFEPERAPRPPRRSFTEMLNSFMEESNIRWGEIIGGLLIIGCSTALVVSLWSQISQIPVLKFLIFTTVTAVLFGIGMYTEHRWKLPTTSRGILTIATLLVPLNFLAIAAVSSGDSSGSLVLASELLAPGIFLCLVYFAGRVITPGCAHLLAAGILGSSVGQLLVRHFATPDAAPELLVFLGAFPVLCYVVAVGLALRFVLKDRKIDETETSTVFTILGTMSFAALLPFGLLLYKSGPLGMSMMYLAPLVTLWGVPMMATGTVLWRRIQDKNLAASRTTGTALGILGLMIALSGMILAWPNPASIIPAALLNFVILTILALVLEIPVAHFLAAGCFGLAYVVLFHVLAGHVEWQNLRVSSLVTTCLDISSGQALIGAFAIFLVVSEWWQQLKRKNESYAYLTAACLTAIISLLVVSAYGPLAGNDLQTVWITYLIHSLGAFWIAWRRRLAVFTWVGSGFLLFTIASQLAWNTNYSFPWQTTLLIHASICAIVAILASRRSTLATISKPLNYAALIGSVLVVVSMFQTNPWQVTSMQAERVFWIAAIFLLSLWLNRLHLLFVAFQIALTGAVILSVKAMLQQYEWYTYLPHAFMHPSALQIQGTVLALLSLIWIAVRVTVRKLEHHSIGGFWKVLDTRHSIDRLIPWVLLGGFVLLSIYGAASGVIQEFALRGTQTSDWNIAGFPHSEAFGIGSWIVWGLLTIIMLANAWERRQRFYLLGAVITVATAIPLIAGGFETELATASAWRFLATAFFAAGSALLWFRARIHAQLKSFGWPTLKSNPEEFVRPLRVLIISLTVGPLLLLTFYPALRAIVRAPVQVPNGGLFGLLNNDFSYAIPLVVVALVLIGHSIRERLPLFSFYAGLLFNVTVTLAYLLSVVSVSAPLDSTALVRTIQLNAITFAAYGLFWLSLRKRWSRVLKTRANQADALLKLEAWLALGLNLLLIGTLAIEMIFGEPGRITAEAGNWLGWFALAISFVSFVLAERSSSERLPAIGLVSILLSLVTLIASGFASDNFIHLRVLAAGTTVAAWIMFGASLLPEFSNQPAIRRLQTTLKLDDHWSRSAITISTIVGFVAVFLSLRLLTVLEIGSDWWWSISQLIALSALAAALQYRTLQRGYLYLAGILINIAVSIWWFSYPAFHGFPLTHFLEANIVVAGVAAILWLWLDLRARSLIQGEARGAFLSYHKLVAFSSVILLIAVTWFRIATGLASTVEIPSSTLTWLAWLTTVVLMFATLWDRRAKYATGGLYTLGLIAGAILLQQLHQPANEQEWSVMMFLAVYALGTSLLWRKRAKLISIAERFGITARIESTATQLTWLSAVSITTVLVVGSIAYWINLRFLSFELRISAAIAIAAQAITLGFLAAGVWQERWRRAAVGAFLIGMVLVGWSWLTPYVNATWLNRSVILMIGAFTLTALYGLLLERLREFHMDWAKSIGSAIPGVVAAGFIALLFCLSTEVFYQINFGSVLINPISLFAIGVTLAATVVIPVWFALSAAHDPLNLSEHGRMKYVYAAELMLGLLFLHVRLTMPWLFHGFFEKYWPFVVMAIAYLGVIASESLRRRKLLVLAQPMERTGAFLPLLPVIGFWLATSEVDYSSLLFVVGGLYGLLSSLRRSFIFGALAGIAGNAGFWYLLQHTHDYQFWQHPQLWLIPVALSVLLAAYLNEDRLSEEQLAGTRYLSLVTIYASSTADIFINGVANSPWLPLILGSFSLAGVFSGIMFKIRGMLLMGSVFLLLSIITMIWYASVNLGWTWLWYVAGIATGATIIFMFAVFEKKRTEVLRVVEGLKEWEI
jgi:hypothetical protein